MNQMDNDDKIIKCLNCGGVHAWRDGLTENEEEYGWKKHSCPKCGDVSHWIDVEEINSITNSVSCKVIEVLSPPYEEFGRWCVDVKYNSWGNIYDGIVYVLTKEEAETVKVGYVFQA